MAKKILIIGQDSYLASNIEYSSNCQVNKILRPFENDFKRYNDFDYIINFCIQPEHFSSLLSEEEMIDVQIAKHITNTNTKYVFLSSRKVYGSNSELQSYKESDELKPFDFYSKNKVNIERCLQDMLQTKLLILRTGNIVGPPANKKNYTTFIGWLEKELINNKKVTITVNKEAKKDFITRKYFQDSLVSLVENNQTGIYNIGSNFAWSIEKLILYILPKQLVEFSPKELNSEQFVLDCSRLYKFIEPFSEGALENACKILGENLLRNI